MGVDVANGQLDTPRLAASPWPYFAGLVVATWVLDLVWHAQFAAHRGGFAVTVSWLIMTLAMMAPTTVPMLGSLVDVVARREPRTFWLFLVGYLAVWAAFAIAIAQAQDALAARGFLDDHGTFSSNNLIGVTLLGAGVYQFTSLKNRCREACMRPMKFFMVHWRSGNVGAVKMGARHGLACLGCCAALMALAFVGGMGNWGFMALATAIMVVEKLPSVGRRVTAPLGVVLLALGAFVLVTQPVSNSHHETSPMHVEGTLP